MLKIYIKSVPWQTTDSYCLLLEFFSVLKNQIFTRVEIPKRWGNSSGCGGQHGAVSMLLTKCQYFVIIDHSLIHSFIHFHPIALLPSLPSLNLLREQVPLGPSCSLNYTQGHSDEFKGWRVLYRDPGTPVTGGSMTFAENRQPVPPTPTLRNEPIVTKVSMPQRSPIHVPNSARNRQLGSCVHSAKGQCQALQPPAYPRGPPPPRHLTRLPSSPDPRQPSTSYLTPISSKILPWHQSRGQVLNASLPPM